MLIIKGGGGGGSSPLTFFCSKKKIGEKKSFKTKTIKRLLPKSKCYCLTILERREFKIFFLSTNHGGRYCFSVFHGPSTLKPISPTMNTDTI